MKKEEIRGILGEPHEFYLNDNNALILSYDGEKHDQQQIQDAGQALAELLPGNQAFFRINRETKHHTYYIVFGLNNSDMLEFSRSLCSFYLIKKH